MTVERTITASKNPQNEPRGLSSRPSREQHNDSGQRHKHCTQRAQAIAFICATSARARRDLVRGGAALRIERDSVVIYKLGGVASTDSSTTHGLDTGESGSQSTKNVSSARLLLRFSTHSSSSYLTHIHSGGSR